MPELERDKLKALCDGFSSAPFAKELRVAVESAEEGVSCKPMSARYVLSLYSFRDSMNEKRQGPMLGFPDLVLALQCTLLGEIVISAVTFEGFNFIVFTDIGISELLGVLRGPVVPHPVLHPPDEMAQFGFKNDLVNIARLLDEGWDIEKVDESGLTQLERSTRKQQLEVVALLLERGAKIGRSLKFAKNLRFRSNGQYKQNLDLIALIESYEATRHVEE